MRMQRAGTARRATIALPYAFGLERIMNVASQDCQCCACSCGCRGAYPRVRSYSSRRLPIIPASRRPAPVKPCYATLDGASRRWIYYPSGGNMEPAIKTPEQLLRYRSLRQILADKPGEVHAVDAGSSVFSAVQVMASANIGFVLVEENAKLVRCCPARLRGRSPFKAGPKDARPRNHDFTRGDSDARPRFPNAWR
jgi:hypothetical protein